ncbi:hypothetical protein KEM56_007181 [Ascosphaera pollenicola]|nr:hypothetical protein KEM56_007181 [Ascosphaera pollenicola]
MSMSQSQSRPSAFQESGSASSFFEQQRGELLQDIALSLEGVLQNLNRLNRNLESVITVGNEFASVEALWSQFENVMGNAENASGENAEEGGPGEDTEMNESSTWDEGDPITRRVALVDERR